MEVDLVITFVILLSVFTTIYMVNRDYPEVEETFANNASPPSNIQMNLGSGSLSAATVKATGATTSGTLTVDGNLTAGSLKIGGTTITEEHLKILTGARSIRLSNSQRGATGGLATNKDLKPSTTFYARNQSATTELKNATQWNIRLTPYTKI